MSDTLPPLPKPGHIGPSSTGRRIDTYTADQMRSYAAAALAAAVAEPLAWLDCERIRDLPAVDEAMRTLMDDQTADNAACLVRAVLEAAAPAAPPQREPLTDERIDAAWDEWFGAYGLRNPAGRYTRRGFARAIERATASAHRPAHRRSRDEIWPQAVTRHAHSDGFNQFRGRIHATPAQGQLTRLHPKQATPRHRIAARDCRPQRRRRSEESRAETEAQQRTEGAGVTRPRVYDGCGRKRAFATEAEAMAWHNPLGLRIYQCTTCQKWHHTRLTLREFQALAKPAVTTSAPKEAP